MNIQINIESPLFGNNTYNDQTNSKIFENLRFIIKQIIKFSRIILYFVIFVSFVYLLFLMSSCI